MTAERAPAMDRASLQLQLRLVSFIRLFYGAAPGSVWPPLSHSRRTRSATRVLENPRGMRVTMRRIPERADDGATTLMCPPSASSTLTTAQPATTRCARDVLRLARRTPSPVEGVEFATVRTPGFLADVA